MKEKMLCAAIAGALLTIAPCASAAADDWLPVATARDGTEHQWLPDSAKKSGSRWIVWTKEIPPSPKPVHKDQPNGKKYEYALMKRVFSCGDMTLGVLSRHEYFAGEVVWSHTFKMHEMDDAIPGSIGESFLELACAVLTP